MSDNSSTPTIDVDQSDEEPALQVDDVVKVLGRDDILDVDDLGFKMVPVPEWGGEVRIRTLTGAERDAYEGSMIRQRGTNTSMNYDNLRAKLVTLCVVDGDGKRLFSNADAVLLGKKSAAALERVFEACQKLSRLRREDIDELAGNFDGNQSDSSGSGSPLP